MGTGENIRRMRMRRSYSQDELAKLANISTNALWRIENGTHAPRPSTVRKLAEALKVEPDELRGDEDVVTSGH